MKLLLDVAAVRDDSVPVVEVDAYDEIYIAELVDALLGVPATLLIG